MEEITINIQGLYPMCPKCNANMLPLGLEGMFYWKCLNCEHIVNS